MLGSSQMAVPERPVIVELPARTLIKVLATAALVLCLWKLADVILLLTVAVVLAVALDAPVAWLERRRLSRGLATIIVTGLLAAAVLAFLWLTWSTLTVQWEYLSSHLSSVTDDLLHRIPRWILPKRDADSSTFLTRLQPTALSLAQSTVLALTLIVLGFFVTIYLLIEAEQTVRWVIAFFPQHRRDKVMQTLSESRAVIQAYAVGNVITSIFAAIWVLVWLVILKVPAALLLAVITGIADFVPVLGFIASVVPAFALALTVSTRTGFIVVGLYVLYHTIENYLIGPWAYGRQLKLSDLAVIVAFVVGAELFGVIGALIALPCAALYPTIERIWLRNQLPGDTVGKHRALTESPSK
jgi:predicted PurR-regulated permease PerM